VARFLHAAVGGLGIDALPPAANSVRRELGWRSLEVKPSPAAVRGLDQASGSRHTPEGFADVHWRRTGARVEINVSVPGAAVANVHVPMLHRTATVTVISDGLASRGCVVTCSNAARATATAVSAADAKSGGDAATCSRWLASAAGECRTRRDGEPVLVLSGLACGNHTIVVNPPPQ
jgi:hypothetical protein